MKGFIISVLFLVASVLSAQVRVDPLVLINGQGLVRGQKATDGDYSTFLGIPYAEIDSKDPFGSAQSPSAFKEIVHYANEDNIKCPQMSSSTSGGTETLDCLRLNIFVPFKASSLNPMPVMVWIHGGEFVRGSGSDYGVANLVRHDIVVVTVNYRLGPYGFMCLDIPEVPGNQGLKDQYLALNWIKTNIASFGGNPYNITISGQDAGATSVLLHLYSDKNKLFHKAIVESGTPQNEGQFVNGDANAAIKLAEHLGFNTSDTNVALAFIKSISPELVTAAAFELNLQLRPCKERSFSGIENFVENDPYSLTNAKKVRKTPVLIGYTNKERDSLSDDYFDVDPFYEKLKNYFNFGDEELEKAARIVRNFYIGDKAVSRDVTSELEDFESDFGYNHPAERIITKLLDEDAGPIYEYVFSYVGDSNAFGAGHSSELNYLFDFTSKNVKRSEEDQLIIDRMTTLWSNFVKYGNPTPATTDLIPVKWEPVTVDTRPSMVIDTDIYLDSRVENQRMAFWDLFYSIYGRNSVVARECSMNQIHQLLIVECTHIPISSPGGDQAEMVRDRKSSNSYL